MAAKGDTQKKPVKGRIDRNGKDNCRLCCCLLKIKFGEFKKTSYISLQNLFKVSKPDGFQDGTLSEICSKIGLEIKKSDTSSYRVCHACARKIRNAFELYDSSTRACRKRRRSRFLAIQADASVFCQLPFRCQIEVLKQEKDIRHPEKTQHQRNH